MNSRLGCQLFFFDLLMNHRILVLALFSLFLSTRGVAQWDSTNFGRYNGSAGVAQSLFASGDVLVAYGEVPTAFQNFDVVSRSSDAGNSWTADTTLGGTFVSSFVTVGNKIFVGTESGSAVGGGGKPGGLFVSSDGGQTWEPRNQGLPDSNVSVNVSALVWDGTTLYRGSATQVDPSDGLFASTDLGATWNPVLSGYNVFSLFRSGGVLVGNVGPLGTKAPTMVSTDNGTHWSPAMGIPDTDHLSVFDTVGPVLVASVGMAGLEEGFWRSTDHGRNWTRPEIPGMDTLSIYAFATSGSTLFAGTNHGVFRSTDAGMSWMPENQGLDNLFIGGLTTTNTYLLAGTLTNVWRRPLSDFEAVNQPAIAGFTATTNYPNPFDRSTAISFSLETPGTVTLHIFNSLGESVARPITESLGAGTHQIEVPGSGLPNGSYMYLLSAGSHSHAGMMLVEHTGQ